MNRRNFFAAGLAGTLFKDVNLISQDSPPAVHVFLTQDEHDALVVKRPDAMYHITDRTPGVWVEVIGHRGRSISSTLTSRFH